MDKKTIQIIVGSIVVFLLILLLSFIFKNDSMLFIATTATAIAFPIGIIMMFFKSTKQWGTALLIYSAFIFLVWGSICSMSGI